MGGGGYPAPPLPRGGREGPSWGGGGLCFAELAPTSNFPYPTPNFPMPLPRFSRKKGSRRAPPYRGRFAGGSPPPPTPSTSPCGREGDGGRAPPPSPPPNSPPTPPAEPPSPAKRFPRITRRAEQGGCLKTQSRSPNEFNYNVVNTLPLRFN